MGLDVKTGLLDLLFPPLCIGCGEPLGAGRGFCPACWSGITFLDGVLYINNVFFNKLYRIPVDANGKAGAPVDIWMDQPVKGPDGMRAANGKIYVAANGSGMVASLTIDGDRAHVTVIKDGLKTPTGVEPAGNTLWIAERGAGKAVPVPLK